MMHSILRPDLRILKEGKHSAQEVDLVLFDGAHKAVIGEHKSHVKSRQPVDKLVKTPENCASVPRKEWESTESSRIGKLD